MLNKNEKTDPYIMIKEKLNEHEKRISDLEIIANDLKEKAKAKLKLGKKECAKRILSKKRKYLGQIKLIEDAVQILETQKMIIDNALLKKNIIDTIKKGNATIKDITKDTSS